MDVKLKFVSVGLKNFRSFPGGTIEIGKGVNIIIGVNNSGKSNLIRAFEKFKECFKITTTKNGTLGIPTVHFGSEDLFDKVGTGAEIEIQYNLETSYNIEYFYKAGVYDNLKNISTELKEKEKLLSLQISFSSTPEKTGIDEKALRQQIQPEIEEIRGGKLLNVEPMIDYFKKDLFDKFSNQIVVVPDMRRITAGDSYTRGGEGAVWWVDRLVSPPDDERDAYANRYGDIRYFIGTLINIPKDEIHLSVNQEKTKIFLHTPDFDKGREVYSLGSGIRELIVLAIDFSHLNNAVIAIEEPEAHLHPDLIRKFLELTIENAKTNNNQYLITTHSNIFLDPLFGNRNVISVVHKNGQSYATPCTTDKVLYETIRSLGNKPSELLLSNCIIWVEGPTDRFYINRWFELLDDSLPENGGYGFIEDIHYTFAFYGGSSLYHMTLADDAEGKGEALSDLLNILSISRNVIVVMDSDLSNEEATEGKELPEINKAVKSRIIDECKTAGYMVWVTKGREMENYIPESVIKEVFKEIEEYGDYDKLGRIEGEGAVPKSSTYLSKKGAKAEKIARLLSPKNFSENRLCIKEKIKSLADQIKLYNE
ncbi:MAG: ATP-binding protein [bacterium]